MCNVQHTANLPPLPPALHSGSPALPNPCPHPTPLSSAGVPGWARLPRRRHCAHTLLRRLLFCRAGTLLQALRRRHVFPCATSARLPPLPRWQLLPTHWPGGCGALPGRHFWQQVFFRFGHRMPALPGQHLLRPSRLSKVRQLQPRAVDGTHDGAEALLALFLRFAGNCRQEVWTVIRRCPATTYRALAAVLDASMQSLQP